MSQAVISSTLRAEFDSLEEIIPSVSIVGSTANGSVFETAEPHWLTTGLTVEILGHAGCVPAVQGSYKVTVVDPTKFTLRDAAVDRPVTLSVGGSGGRVRANLTAWSNVHFTPVLGVPYQRVHFLFAQPQNPSFGGEHTRESGFMQIDLHYPKNTGTASVEFRAEEIRYHFRRGATFTLDGITTHVSGTPQTLGGEVEEESYKLSVRVPFWADVLE